MPNFTNVLILALFLSGNCISYSADLDPNNLEVSSSKDQLNQVIEHPDSTAVIVLAPYDNFRRSEVGGNYYDTITNFTQIESNTLLLDIREPSENQDFGRVSFNPKSTLNEMILQNLRTNTEKTISHDAKTGWHFTRSDSISTNGEMNSELKAKYSSQLRKLVLVVTPDLLYHLNHQKPLDENSNSPSQNATIGTVEAGHLKTLQYWIHANVEITQFTDLQEIHVLFLNPFSIEITEALQSGLHEIDLQTLVKSANGPGGPILRKFDVPIVYTGFKMPILPIGPNQPQDFIDNLNKKWSIWRDGFGLGLWLTLYKFINANAASTYDFAEITALTVLIFPFFVPSIRDLLLKKLVLLYHKLSPANQTQSLWPVQFKVHSKGSNYKSQIQVTELLDPNDHFSNVCSKTLNH